MTIKIGLNGFGRIGRCIIRAIYEHNIQDNIKVTAINAPSMIKSYAHLLKYDSVHGKFTENIVVNDNNIVINDDIMQVTQYKNPSEINWQNCDIVIDSTGKFKTRAELSQHLQNNVTKVLITAPCSDADSTIIYGVNNDEFKNIHQVVSVGSCTTNALVPMVKIFQDSFGIDKGFFTTIHSYTNDQCLLDNAHKDLRRARACNLSMIPTKTGAATTINQIIPELTGKIDGCAVRVPTPNVSLLDFTFVSKQATNNSEINKIFKQAVERDKFAIIDYLTEELVSTDLNHTTKSCIFDPFETKVTDNNLVRIICWYDNEWAYSARVLDVLRLIAA